MASTPMDIDDAVTLAVDKALCPSTSAKTATEPKRKQKPSETDVNLDAVGIGDIVAQIVVAIQPMIVKYVTEAINDAQATTTKVIISELKEELQSGIKTVNDDMCKVKQEIQKQKWKLDALEQYSRRESARTPPLNTRSLATAGARVHGPHR